MLIASQQDTRNRLCAAARRLFAGRGYAAVSMRDLAEAVGVRQSAIYNHFKGKQDLLVEIMTTHMNALFEAHQEAMQGAVTPIERLRAFAQFHVGYHIDFPDDVFIAYMELRSLDQAGQDQIVALRNRYEDGLREILEAGVQDGSFVISDAAVHARILLSMLTGVTVWYRDNGRLDRGEVVECYVVAALNSVGLNGAETLRKGG